MNRDARSSAENILDAQALYKSYGAIPVLNGVSISVRAQETHVVIGPNGAGKTTLFKVLSGEVLADRGAITFQGRSVDRIDGYRRVLMGIGRTFQVARVFGEASVLDNMIVAVEERQQGTGLLALLSPWVRPRPAVVAEAMAVLEEMGLAAQRDEIAGVLAYGDRKGLELGMCLALRPTLLMLDEPMAGMSPADRTAAVGVIRRVARQSGISVLLTEHDMDVVFALADRITVLNYGEVIASGSPEEVRASPTVREVYLGHEAHHA
jgi:branched-chain amino acid transport system ATP-binding protein